MNLYSSKSQANTWEKVLGGSTACIGRGGQLSGNVAILLVKECTGDDTRTTPKGPECDDNAQPNSAGSVNSTQDRHAETRRNAGSAQTIPTYISTRFDAESSAMMSKI